MKRLLISVFLFSTTVLSFAQGPQGVSAVTSPQMHSDAVILPYRKTVADKMQYQAYAAANSCVATTDVVLMGDSITDLWYQAHPDFFDGNGYIGRGVGGQGTIGILGRFRKDVINLHPKVVVILAGINDIAQNDGVMDYQDIVDNLANMCDLAKANGIEPLLCSLTPCSTFYWNKEARPAPEVVVVNAMIEEYAQRAGITYVDYYTSMADADGGMKEGLSKDGCHPTAAGYDVMESVILNHISSVLGK